MGSYTWRAYTLKSTLRSYRMEPLLEHLRARRSTHFTHPVKASKLSPSVLRDFILLLISLVISSSTRPSTPLTLSLFLPIPPRPPLLSHRRHPVGLVRPSTPLTTKPSGRSFRLRRSSILRAAAWALKSPRRCGRRSGHGSPSRVRRAATKEMATGGGFLRRGGSRLRSVAALKRCCGCMCRVG